MKTRGQITLFVIIGLVMLISTIAIFALVTVFETKQISESKARVDSDLYDKAKIKPYTELCIKQELENGIKLMSAQGGYLYKDQPGSVLNSEIKIREEPLPKIAPKENTGIGVTEAPRGVLYHSYSIGADGLIKKGNIVVPTLQNTRNIESDLKKFIPSLMHLQQETAELEIEKLIRAYDPCISCSTHFLKVNWKLL